MRIRKFKPEDAGQIKRLHYNTVNKINVKDYTREQREAWSPRDFSKKNMKGLGKFFTVERITVVAEDHGEILGYAALSREGKLNALYVHKDHQGEGIGTTLLRKVEEEAIRRGITEVRLESTLTARSYYRQQGYKDLGEAEKDMRGVKLQVVRMKKHLKKTNL